MTDLDVALLAMTMASGFLDTVSFLRLGGVFTSVMTGNTLILGLGIGEGHLKLALRSGTALLGFIAGGLLASALIAHDRDAEDAWPPTVTVIMLLELACLLGFALVYVTHPTVTSRVYRELLLALGGTAMGLQSLAVFRMGPPGIATTYFTGTLVTVLSSLIGPVFLAYRHRRQVIMFLGYLASAVLAAVILGVAGWVAAAAPAILLGVVVGIHLVSAREPKKAGGEV